MSGIHYDRPKNLARIKQFDQLLENYRKKIYLQLERRVSSTKFIEHNNKQDVEFVLREEFTPEMVLNEDNIYVPRFKVKKQKNQLFSKFPPNKEFKYSRDMMELAINYGMILLIQYRGETGSSQDNFVQGHQRVIYPMVLGRSSKNNPLLRGYHLRGWSVSKNGNTQKDWRMFRADRILSMSFTGSFFRLPPSGYNMNDKHMVGGIIAAADFSVIRQNQKKLIDGSVIQNKKEVVLDQPPKEEKKRKKIYAIQIESTDTVLDLEKPFDNPNLDEEDKSITRLTFLKALGSQKYICVVGALGERNSIVKLTERGKYLGSFRVMKAVMGDHLDKPHLRKLEGKEEFDLAIFVKRLN